MKHILYRCAVLLHPPWFRRRFGDQMLSIFEEAEPSSGSTVLMVDAVVSVFRQWILRSRLWLLLASASGALLTMAAGTALVPRLRFGSGLITDSPPRFVVLAAAVCLMAVSFTLLLCVYWFRFSRRRRA